MTSVFLVVYSCGEYAEGGANSLNDLSLRSGNASKNVTYLALLTNLWQANSAGQKFSES